MVSTVMAYCAVRNRRREAHKEWMIRSYVITSAFVAFRWVVDWPLPAGLGLERFATAGWLCWAAPLFLAEVALQWKRSFPRGRARAGGVDLHLSRLLA